MASILDIAKGKRITIALENYSTTNSTDFVIGLGSLEGYLTKKYDSSNNLVFASKWLSAPSIAIEQDGATVNAVGADEIARYDTLQNYFKLYNFRVNELRIEGVSGLVSSQITIKKAFLSHQSEDVNQTINIDPYQNQSDIFVGHFPVVIGRDGGIILKVSNGTSAGPTIVKLEFTIQEIVPVSEDILADSYSAEDPILATNITDSGSVHTNTIPSGTIRTSSSETPDDYDLNKPAEIKPPLKIPVNTEDISGQIVEGFDFLLGFGVEFYARISVFEDKNEFVRAKMLYKKLQQTQDSEIEVSNEEYELYEKYSVYLDLLKQKKLEAKEKAKLRESIKKWLGEVNIELHPGIYLLIAVLGIVASKFILIQTAKKSLKKNEI